MIPGPSTQPVTQPTSALNPTTDAGTTVLIAGDATTGTAPLNLGPGSAAALETALNNYLTAELGRAGSQTAPTLPTPQQNGEPQVIVRPAPASGGGPSLPVVVTVAATAVGVVSGLAYLIDRHRKEKK